MALVIAFLSGLGRPSLENKILGTKVGIAQDHDGDGLFRDVLNRMGKQIRSYKASKWI